MSSWYRKKKEKLSADPAALKLFLAAQTAKVTAYTKRVLADPCRREKYLASRREIARRKRAKLKARIEADPELRKARSKQNSARARASYQRAKESEPERYARLKAAQRAREARNRKPRDPQYYRDWRAKRKAQLASVNPES